MTSIVMKTSNNITTGSSTTKQGAAAVIAALILTCLPTSLAFVGSTTGSQTTLVGSNDKASLSSSSWNSHRSLRRTRPMELTSSSRVVSSGRRNNNSRSSSRSTTTSALSAFMVDEVSRAVQLFYETKPIEAAFLTCSVKASAADAIAQVREVSDDDDNDVSEEEHNWEPSIIQNHKVQASKSKTFDPLQIMKDPSSAFQSATQAVTSVSMEDMYVGPIKLPRNVAFLLYGGLYSGIGQHIIYNEIYPYLFGSSKDIHTVATKILFDQLIHGPFLCLPLSYIFKSVVYQESISKAIDKYVSDVTNKGLLLKYWMVWTPFELVMYNYVPSYLIIPFISMISFFWLIVLSSVANSQDAVETSVSSSSTTSSSTPSLTVSQTRLSSSMN